MAERERCALVLGHEGEGLSAAAMAACERRVRIPMTGFDSLNVATAAAIALYALGPADRCGPSR
ncbi:tRNA guanosine-2'-O-methyltransferase [compost metagenome]